MDKKNTAIDMALRTKLAEWIIECKTGKELPGLTHSSKSFSIVGFNPEKDWVIVKSDIYPPFNILDYGKLLKGIQMELDGSVEIHNSNDYSTIIEESPINRKMKNGNSSVSILTKYYRVIHMKFITWYVSAKTKNGMVK